MSPHPELDALRLQLQERGVTDGDLVADPFVQFHQWFDLCIGAGMHEPEAMIVSSVGEESQPSSRHVLLRGVDHGFVFFTNYESQKGRELTAHPRAAICFPWNLLARQVRVVGSVEKVTATESDAYFATRPRGSQIGAWASRQSEVIADRSVLEEWYAQVEARFEGREVTRPPHWGGFRVLPEEFEFWQGRESRLHDRFRYVVDPDTPAGWRPERLSP
ncbi:MAG: pyridoxamine 5'-phosphate oxidase [Actinobacteria bacterium]|nr:pyridoxamine 5'-phosphate oxidase [Actinomycetota bacterium]